MRARHAITAILMLLAKAVSAQLANEIPLSPPLYGPVNVTNIANPFTASDGTNFLVAWMDGRVPGSATIYANRVTRTGEALDGTGIRIPNDPANPAASPDLIVGLFHVDGAYTLFYEHRGQSNPQLNPIATYAVIIGDDGRILDGPRQVFVASVWRMASSGSRVVALIGNDIFVLNGHADVINRFSLPVFAGGNPFNAAIGSNGSTFLLVRFGVNNSSSGFLYFADLLAFDTSGHFSSATRVKDVNGSGGVTTLVQSDGTDYLVVCFLSVLSVSAQAELRSRSDLIRSQYLETAALSWTGQTYLLAAAARDNTQQMAVLTLARAGSAIGNLRKIEPEAQRSFTPAMATNGTEALVAWMSQPSATTMTVRAAVIDAAGTPHTPVLTLPSASNVQSHAAIATGGIYDLAVWEEADGMYATRVTSAGSPLDGRGILVAQKAAAQSAGTFRPRVVFDGTAYLVAWGPGSVRGQRIDPATGHLLDAPITLASCAGSFDLESDGKSPVLFVAGCDPQLYAQRVDAIGTTGPRVPIFPAGTSLSQPRAFWNGHEWLVAWQEYRGGTNAYFGRVTSELTPLDTMPVLDPTPPFDDESPQVASDGHDAVVVLTRSGSNWGVYFRTMHSDGTAGQSTLLAPNARSASLVWDGSQYVVLYTQTCTLPCRPRSYLSHFRVQADQPVISDKVPIDESILSDGMLAVLGNGRVRMVYTRNAIEPLYGSSPRVFLRDDYASVPRRRAAGGR